MTTSQHQIRFPQESEVYRTARDDLLQAELELRRQLEWVAALRRNLPLGGALTEDYLFDEGDPDLDAFGVTRKIRLSELFADGKDSLILYSFMYGPDMARPCASCTSMLDGLNGNMLHALQQVNVAVVAKSPIQRILLFALQRGWHNLHMLSSAHNSFNADYHGETKPPMAASFRRSTCLCAGQGGFTISTIQNYSIRSGVPPKSRATSICSGRCGTCLI
jgi:predicted dithiol-disulfide oxidoreductase (DUF899 family)